MVSPKRNFSDHLQRVSPVPSESVKPHLSSNSWVVEMKEAPPALIPIGIVKEPAAKFDALVDEDSGREKLKRHRVEVAGRVWIPDSWGQEKLMKDWIDCSAFNASLVPAGLLSARQALIEDRRRANSIGLRMKETTVGEAAVSSPSRS
ncbi:hypothetical protein MKW98_019972 [Papaver atlanticum]|uniref:Uncharacterized protein n=1 Tax=Papaver atlanticum TaxID=357466 RepID=A0AAD4X797_9MAGN|nr:hypothetical protein MKW98_019972 [Papaver atlanticum]